MQICTHIVKSLCVRLHIVYRSLCVPLLRVHALSACARDSETGLYRLLHAYTDTLRVWVCVCVLWLCVVVTNCTA